MEIKVVEEENSYINPSQTVVITCTQAQRSMCEAIFNILTTILSNQMYLLFKS